MTATPGNGGGNASGGAGNGGGNASGGGGNDGNGGGPVAFVHARLFDPATGLDGDGGLVVRDGLIADLGAHITLDSVPPGMAVVDCGGHILAPGLIDMRVFSGEPGHEHRETLATASHAAAAGGVTTIVTMPDTIPVIDDAALVDYMLRRARDTALVNVAPMAALTKGLQGEVMTEFGLLKEAGAVGVTDGERMVANPLLLRRALAYARDFDLLVVQHTEDPVLAASGVMNEGEVSTRLGLPGIPAAAETMALERDMHLVELTGARYHAAQVTCRASLDVIRAAKDKGLPVTCGVSINHLTLNETDIGAYRTFFKLSPPLRPETDRRAMVEGVADGTIDVVVSSHDPQDPDTKRRPFAEAEFGAIGLETLTSAALSLVHAGEVSLARMIHAMTAAPAQILGFPAGRLATGAPADLVLIDPTFTWTVDPEHLKSKAKNTPFEGREFVGDAIRTVVAGQTVYNRLE